MSAFLHDNLRVHGHSNMEFRERELGQCGSCGANLNQLKQEAILLALSRGQSLAKPPFGAGLSAGTALGQSGTKHGDKSSREVVHPPYSPRSPRSPRTPQRTPQTLRRRGPKLPNPDMDRWVEEQQQLVASKSASNPDGVTINSHHPVPLKAFSKLYTLYNTFPSVLPSLPPLALMSYMDNACLYERTCRQAKRFIEPNQSLFRSRG